MNNRIVYSSQVRTSLARRWELQAEELHELENKLLSESTSALPPQTQAAARTFLEMWQRTARKARVTTEVYADELRDAALAFEDIEAEIVRRIDALGPIDR